MTNERTYQGAWRNLKAEQKYRELDAAGWARATATPPDQADVPTRFGSTRAYHWRGPGPAVVFLHGMSDTSVRWVPFAERLAEFDVWAIDIMGDVGNSVQEFGFSTAADYSVWLGETLDGLGVNRPHVVGHSLGGYIALTYAMGEQRVSSTIAFDPVGVVKLRLGRFMAWGFGNALAAKTPEPLRASLARRRRYPLISDRDSMRLLTHANMSHPPAMPPLAVFTDEDLASIADPLMVIAGEHSSAFDVTLMVERINRLVPRGEAALLADAGHAVTHTHFEECLDVIRAAAALGTVG